MSDRKLERTFIEEVSAHLGLTPSESDEFTELVLKRLDHGAGEYGEDAYLSRSFPGLVAEAAEEQTDAGGWSERALRILERAVRNGWCDRSNADLVRLEVIEATALALRSWEHYQRAIELFQEVCPTEETYPKPQTYSDREQLAA